MCRYSYISGACANRRIESLQCVGEEDCEFSDMNILLPPSDAKEGGDSLAQEWHRLYCDAHNRYLCDLRDDCPRQMSSEPRGVSQRQHRIVDDERGIW